MALQRQGVHLTGKAEKAAQRMWVLKDVLDLYMQNMLVRRKSLNKREKLTRCVRVSSVIGGVWVKETNGRHQGWKLNGSRLWNTKLRNCGSIWWTIGKKPLQILGCKMIWSEKPERQSNEIWVMKWINSHIFKLLLSSWGDVFRQWATLPSGFWLGLANGKHQWAIAGRKESEVRVCIP